MSVPSVLDDPDVYRSLVEGIPAILYIDRPDDLSTNFYTSPQAVDLLDLDGVALDGMTATVEHLLHRERRRA